jgi:LPS export ABC transporter protein LptC
MKNVMNKRNLLYLLFALFSCQEETITQSKLGEKEKYTGPLITYERVVTMYSEDAKIKIKLKAPLQLVLQNGDIEYPKGMEIGVYNNMGVKTTILKGKQGKYIKATAIYKAKGDVVVTNLVEQQTLYSDEISWDQNKREIFTDKAVEIITPRETLYGIGLTSNEDFSRYTIWKPTGVFEWSK